MKLRQVLPSVAILASTANAGFSISSKSNVVVYWGQNSYGQGSGDLAQQKLSTYCDDDNIDVVVLSFLTKFKGLGGMPEINFANQGDKDHCTKFPGTNLLDCPEIAADIRSCQFRGKTILLSLGGQTYSEGGFISASEAEQHALQVWSIFGPASPNLNYNAVPRPFGASVIDGFDFDYEAAVTNMNPFALKLRSLMDEAGTKLGRKFLLTAAPQCPFPDLAMDPMLNGPVAFDAVMIQFYNNFCGINSYSPSASAPVSPTPPAPYAPPAVAPPAAPAIAPSKSYFRQFSARQIPANANSAFNFATWDNWARTVSKNRNVKLLLGVPASSTAAGTGYLSVDKLKAVVEYSKRFASFGGVMMWDVSQAYANEGFLDGVKEMLDGKKEKGKREVIFAA